MQTEDATFEALQLRVVVDRGGNKFYSNHKNQHHRTDGPAIELANGDKYWFLNGVRHRTDGPAVELLSGDKWWYINDKRLSEYEFLKHPLCTIK